MIRHRAGSVLVQQFALLLLTVHVLPAQLPARMGSANLAGTSWQLVKFQGSDGRILTPDVATNYTIAFETDGRVSARIDCNRGNGTWATGGSNQLTFGPLVTTRMRCSPISLFDSIVRNWPYVRSYTIRNGHLFLSLQADGGSYEFEPIGSEQTAGTAVRGTATYRDRVALPRNAVFEASLEDVSGAGDQSELIARTRNEQPGNVPIPFVISYDPSRIVQGHSYSVRGRILVNGTPWFTTDQSYPVVTGGRGSDVQLLLRRVASSGVVVPPRAGVGTTSLEETHWKLIEVNGIPVTTDARVPEANLTLHQSNHTVSGNGGCNRFSGSYSLNGDRLTFSQVMSTMMACVAPNPETPFRRAISATRRWRIDGQTLELLDDSRNVIARLEAVYM
jgi:heat shock protein HslJ/uncharacterized lipoprotein YbaY